jgi:hypothetical protein
VRPKIHTVVGSNSTHAFVVKTERGVFEHGSICFLYFEMHYTYFDLFKIEIKKIRMYIFMCYTFTKLFHKK